MDTAVVGAGINLTFDAAGMCTDARVSIGAVAERALPVHEGIAALIGSTIDEHALKRMAAARERVWNSVRIAFLLYQTLEQARAAALSGRTCKMLYPRGNQEKRQHGYRESCRY
jgi:hypothetical protein